MWVELWNSRSKLVKATDEERAWLDEYLTFDSVAYGYGGRRMVKQLRELNPFNSTFATGYVYLAQRAAAKEGIELVVVDKRTPPCELDTAADLEWLRDYQRKAVDAVVSKTRGILWIPTGGGKTEVAVGLTRALPCRWLFLVHRTNLADQAAGRYELRTPGVLAGRIGEGEWNVPADATFIASTLQTMHRGMKSGDKRVQELLEWADGVIVDESHTLPADSFREVVMSCTNAYYRIGLSGTPLARGDRRSVFSIATLGPVIYRIKPELLIERGVLAKPTIRMLTVGQASDKPTWQGVYGECVVRSKVRNAAVVELAKRAEKPALVFVKEVAHGKELTKYLGRAGLKAEFVWGTHSVDWRKSHVKRLVQGHFDVLVCSAIFQEGVDIPELRSVVIASGGKSVIAALQRLGRGMRIERDKDGKVTKDTFEAFDVADRGNKWLERHAKARAKAYAGEGFATIIEPPMVPHLARGK